MEKLKRTETGIVSTDFDGYKNRKKQKLYSDRNEQRLNTIEQELNFLHREIEKLKRER